MRKIGAVGSPITFYVDASVLVDPNVLLTSWEGNFHSLAVSGALLAEISDRLGVHRKQRSDIQKRIVELHSSGASGLTRWRELQELLRDLAEANALIIRLSGLFKRVKRELRCREQDSERAAFCGIDFSKRIWFLLHGSHPPHTVHVFSGGFVLGG